MKLSIHGARRVKLMEKQNGDIRSQHGASPQPKDCDADSDPRAQLLSTRLFGSLPAALASILLQRLDPTTPSLAPYCY